jgi:ERCC4-type nuclease
MSERQKIGKDFGEGKYLKIEDGDERIVLIADWGSETRETKFKNKKGEEEIKIVEYFCADVLFADGKRYEVGEKVLETSSINFKLAVKPFVLKAQEDGKNTLGLRIIRSGSSKETTYIIKEMSTSEMKASQKEEEGDTEVEQVK